MVETTQDKFQDASDDGNRDRIRILMRFLTFMMCSKVPVPSSLVVIFETLLSSAATTLNEEKGNPSRQACGDICVSCILSCLPWGGSELIEVLWKMLPIRVLFVKFAECLCTLLQQVPEEIESVMVGIEAYLSIKRHNSDTGLSFLEDDDESGSDVVDKVLFLCYWYSLMSLSHICKSKNRCILTIYGKNWLLSTDIFFVEGRNRSLCSAMYLMQYSF
ncbi:nuclear cap-binding protein subunit 1 [Populus alba x Populus x berolinensis]|nr:nuclear cap-binding protein subunit 1 [Populus alba x Populus x berolinensis]